MADVVFFFFSSYSYYKVKIRWSVFSVWSKPKKKKTFWGDVRKSLLYDDDLDCSCGLKSPFLAKDNGTRCLKKLKAVLHKVNIELLLEWMGRRVLCFYRYSCVELKYLQDKSTLSVGISYQQNLSRMLAIVFTLG